MCVYVRFLFVTGERSVSKRPLRCILYVIYYYNNVVDCLVRLYIFHDLKIEVLNRIAELHV